MTKEQLKKANQINHELERLSYFVKDCRNCWHVMRLRKPKNFRLYTSYGAISNEVEVGEELSERILKTMEEYMAEKQSELENM